MSGNSSLTMFLVANKADLEGDRKVRNEVFPVNYCILFRGSVDSISRNIN